MIEIELPGMGEQRRRVYEREAARACDALKANLAAPVIKTDTAIDICEYGAEHLLTQDNGWKPPAPQLITSLFRQFQAHFPEYDTDEKLARLLGMGRSRAIRSFKNGETPVPYGIWRRFLILTGRASQEIIPVLGFFP